MFQNLPIKIFADGADLQTMIALSKEPYIDGFTTNPTLMRQSGVTDYLAFATDLTTAIPDKPISFEVIADDAQMMERQARRLAALGPQVYVKIPITNTSGLSSLPSIHTLSRAGIKVNVTAVLTITQIECAAKALRGGAPSILSVFAGRIADTGLEPYPFIARALMDSRQPTEVLWASAREILNIKQAAHCGCHIITLPYPMILKAVQLWGYDLAQLSLDTVRMFADDAKKAGLQIQN